jgi:hypothetical protein
MLVFISGFIAKAAIWWVNVFHHIDLNELADFRKLFSNNCYEKDQKHLLDQHHLICRLYGLYCRTGYFTGS